MSRPLPLEEPGDAALSYALMPYERPAPATGKLRSAALFLHSLDHADAAPAVDALVAASVEEFGRGGTAWGVKSDGRTVTWELYWYYHFDHRPLTFDRVARTVAAAGLEPPELPASDRSWYSLSIDVGDDVGAVHAYTTHSPATPRTALSYRIDPGGNTLENVYYLFDPVADRPAIESYLATSVFPLHEAGPADAVLWPELAGGDHVALAHKPHAEGVYHGGIGTDALAAFLRRTPLGPVLGDLVDAERDRLDHLRHDVGVDVVWGPSGPEVVKAGVYGHI